MTKASQIQIWQLFVIAIGFVAIFRREWLLGRFEGNLAFIAVNHLPSSLLTGQIADDVANRLERQLTHAVSFNPEWVSAWRSLALIRRAHGNSIGAAEAWRHVGPLAQDLTDWGTQLAPAGRYDEAIYLLTWASESGADIGDVWHYLAEVYIIEGRWPEAFDAWDNASQSQTWIEVRPSDVFLAKGMLYHHGLQQPDPAEALANYRQALHVDDFSQIHLKGDAYAQLGELYLREFNDPILAIPMLRAALAITPTDHWAHLRLGIAIYSAYGDLPTAEEEIHQALATWPDRKHIIWPYYYLGQIYEDAGQIELALQTYEEVLRLNPDDTRVQNIVQKLKGE